MIWKVLSDFNGEFEVSNTGKVRRVGSHEISQFMDKRHNKAHYMKVCLWSKKEKKVYTRWVHRLVMEGFVGKRPKDCVINHINFDKSDNRLENLEYVTCSDNIRKSLRDGNDKTKLSQKAVFRIMKLYKLGVTPRELGLIYGINSDYASCVARKKNWKWLHQP